MKKYIIAVLSYIMLIIASISLTGCSSKQYIVKKEYIHTKCPTFDYKLDIEIYKCPCGNCISDDDLKELVLFLKKRKDFNRMVKELNEKDFNDAERKN